MDSTLIAAHLVFKELGVIPDTTRLNCRIATQKSMYLAATAGVDLGYVFGWYHRGPFSKELAKDCRELEGSLRADDPALRGRQLIAMAKFKLARLKPLMEVPTGMNLDDQPLPQHFWLETISSVSFLLDHSGLSTPEMEKLIQKQRPELSPFVARAKSLLQQAGFLKSAA